MQIKFQKNYKMIIMAKIMIIPQNKFEKQKILKLLIPKVLIKFVFFLDK